MKKIGFLSFGHWNPHPQSRTRSAGDVLRQSIDLAVAAEELGADGAYFRVHHFAQQLASPFPLLAAVGAKTSNIEIGTGVIDMRYENPFSMAENAGAADLIAGGRLQLGLSRGSPEQVIDGWRHFGFQPAPGETEQDMARRHTEVFLELLKGEGFAQPHPRPMFSNPPGLLRLEPHSEGLRERIWWGAASNATAVWAAQKGMYLQSSTLKTDESGQPFHVQQAEQLRAYKAAWQQAGHTRPRARRSAAAFLPSPTTSTGPTSAGRGTATSSDASTITARCLGAVMPLSRTSSLKNCARTKRLPRPTRCCSPCPTSLAWSTTPTSSRAS
ncbi:LLM class flavin-dependent oxidoreductase [Deinococcus radiodurans]|uniref:LLM class flavin-dependent oxidoreductase n=1 Tax=Deinococcus radiodurans TaxID=1299 RepID=UPI001FB71716|nr:LLM class flavin-dependent oxidoreductase [Deinococcus radiodurans]UTA50184.1 LLM class flavin-dependent oxidoreductase [Deinococcus radiodurans]